MNFGSFKASAVSMASAFVASLCCLLPLTVVLLGLGSGAFMMITMQYRTIFLPIGVIGVSLGYYLYFRERRRCTNLGCTLVGGRTHLILLVLATVAVAASLILDIFPELTSEVLQGGM